MIDPYGRHAYGSSPGSDWVQQHGSELYSESYWSHAQNCISCCRLWMMDQICALSRSNCQFQAQIDILQPQVDTIEQVLNSTGICWADYIALDLVRSKLVEQIELLKWQKEINKRQMSNVLVRALPKQ